jgi:ribonuclease E
LEADAPPVAQPREEPPKPAAVSLWHKIFGAPAEPTAKFAEPSEDATEPAEEFVAREESRDMGIRDEIRSLSGEDVLAEGFIDEMDRAEEPESDESSDTERKRGRPRRRRRGGRGRRSGPRDGERSRDEPRSLQPRDSLESGDDFDDLDVMEPDDEFAEALAPAGQFTADENSDGAADDGSDLGRGKAAQRAIPSWDEAIGFIVDANMQSRSQRRPPSRSQSGGSSSRRRPRGGGRRKG